MCQLSKESNRLKLRLNAKERKTLIHIRQRDPKPYKRERAAALLKIAEGQSPHEVAQRGLLLPRDPDTVYSWVKDFAHEGIKSLIHKERKKEERVTERQKQQLEKILTQKTPQDYGSLRCRWSLNTLLTLIPFLAGVYTTPSGIWYLLKRMRISYKRGREWQRSPDRAKAYKIRRIRAYLGYARKWREKAVLLFLDEFSFYRQPVVGPTWWPMGSGNQPKAVRACTSNTRGRIVGAINAVTGQLSYPIASAITVNKLCEFLVTLRTQYSHGEKIYLVLDNWHNVHRHEQVLSVMEELGIIPLFLPTYSPESNPIEKLWKALTASVLKLHRDSCDWSALKQHVTDWLNQFLAPGKELLRMVGLLSRPAIEQNA